MTHDPSAIRVRLMRLPHAEGLEAPAYASEGAAGMDLRAAVEQPFELLAGAIAKVPTGFAIEVPEGFEVQLRPRSGLAAKHGVTLANSPATIDSDYRGEVFVAMINLGREPLTIERGMRVAQLVLARVPRIAWELADSLEPTARGSGGFGHTGAS